MLMIVLVILGMFILLGIGFVVVFGCLGIFLLIDSLFHRDERKAQRQKMDEENRKAEQMLANTRRENEKLRKQIKNK